MGGKIRNWAVRFWRFVSKPASVICMIGIGGFLIDMLWKPITNAGLILLLAAAAPWVLRTVKRLKVGNFEIETLTIAESERKLEAEAEEILQDSSDTNGVSGEGSASHEQPSVGGTGEDPEPDASQDPETTSPREAPAASESPALNRTVKTPDNDGRELAVRRWVSRIRITESLALDWIERRLQAPIRREVRVGNTAIDAVAMTTPAPTLIEIKTVGATKNVSRRIREGASYLADARQSWAQRHGELPKAMLLLVTDLSPGEEDYEILMSNVRTAEARDVHNLQFKVVSGFELGLERGWMTRVTP